MKIPIVSSTIALLSVTPLIGQPAHTTLGHRASMSDLIVVGTATDSETVDIKTVLKGNHDLTTVTVTPRFDIDEDGNKIWVSTYNTALEPEGRYLLFLVRSKNGEYHLAWNYLSACKIEDGLVDHRGFDFKNAAIGVIEREIRRFVRAALAEQDGADQPATVAGGQAADQEKPQPESEVRSQ